LNVVKTSDEPSPVFCRHLLLCRTIWFDANDPNETFSLGRIFVRLRPATGVGFPFSVDQSFAFFQLFGEAGDYVVELERVRVAADNSGEEMTSDELTVGVWPVLVSGEKTVENYGVRLRAMPFDGTGPFEFRLLLYRPDGKVLLATERVEIVE
jgi:hypothetical protein